MHLILASSSPYRRRLLERLRLPFEVSAPGVDEAPAAGESGPALALRLAREKAQAVADVNPAAVVIGSDQVPCLGDELLRKPGSEENARKQLQRCSGRSVVFHTGLVVLAPDAEPLATVVPFTVHFRVLQTPAIERYLALDEPYDCAGSFKWESLGIALFERLEGDDPTALEGLPLIALCGMLRESGLDPLDADI
ncbi:MAG: nucleoside triphosphate pyrophosphatase [Halieaceae bacterium]|nr:nucleoside triphosphate pyrophosphatase [Halieaceae bacterium]